VQPGSKAFILRHELRGIAVTLLLVAAITLLAAFLHHYLGVLRGSVLFLVPVMVAGYRYGLLQALIAAIAGVLLSGYLFFAQLYTMRVVSPAEMLNFLLFMVVAVVVSQLSSTAKRHITLARQRERSCEEPHDSVVRTSVLGRLGDANLPCVAMPADDRSAPGARADPKSQPRRRNAHELKVRPRPLLRPSCRA